MDELRAAVGFSLWVAAASTALSLATGVFFAVRGARVLWQVPLAMPHLTMAVVVLHLLDADEVQFPFQALTSFRDLETGTQLMTDPLRLRKLYLERLDKFRAAIKEGCASAGADYRFVDTSEPIELVLRDYLLFRRERGR